MAITIDGTGNITGLVAGGLPDLSVTNADLASDAVSTSKLLNASVTTAKLGTNEQSGLCRAWVNFNGTGTVAIRASFNVSSITDNGVGKYQVNMTTAMSDANYSFVASANRWTGAGVASIVTASAFVFWSTDGVGTTTDSDFCFAAVFR